MPEPTSTLPDYPPISVFELLGKAVAELEAARARIVQLENLLLGGAVADQGDA